MFNIQSALGLSLHLGKLDQLLTQGIDFVIFNQVYRPFIQGVVLTLEMSVSLGLFLESLQANRTLERFQV